MKNRIKQRKNRKEKLLDKTNNYGYKDLTPYNAVRVMKQGDKADIRLH